MKNAWNLFIIMSIAVIVYAVYDHWNRYERWIPMPEWCPEICQQNGAQADPTKEGCVCK